MYRNKLNFKSYLMNKLVNFNANNFEIYLHNWYLILIKEVKMGFQSFKQYKKSNTKY